MTAAMSSTAAAKAASLPFDGLAKPLTLRTNWSDGRANLVLRHRRLEVEEHADVPAHGDTSYPDVVARGARRRVAGVDDAARLDDQRVTLARARA